MYSLYESKDKFEARVEKSVEAIEFHIERAVEMEQIYKDIVKDCVDMINIQKKYIETMEKQLKDFKYNSKYIETQILFEDNIASLELAEVQQLKWKKNAAKWSDELARVLAQKARVEKIG